MKLRFLIGAILIPVLPLAARTIDVTSATVQQLNSQDELLFTFSEWSYSVHAPQQGWTPYPARITFDLLILPELAGGVPWETGSFGAILESRDGSVQAAFPGALSWSAGRYQSSLYTGPVAILQGSMDLSGAIAGELFAGKSAVLALVNEGSPVEIGLPPYTLGQDLRVSLSGGGGGVSGPVAQVRYTEAPSNVPEPGSGLVLVVLGAALWVFAKGLNRVRRRGIK